ncbi:histidinol dehydrogenase [Haloflavibacter putidus]|uniref:Histidinol dehydrogenase n=1 Tax=Haloflavibacter putidus TaxID=2576776 RepID=A0A507ZNL3_9FLAO|nr:histidinol dehydrogenase [Haloflavibacter putidus]TQD39326.1 histidinol dehydrogenase [Haloflavibacter putidus]
MNKKVLRISVLPAIGALIFLSFSKKEKANNAVDLFEEFKVELNTTDLPDYFTVLPEIETTENIFKPLLKKDYIGFKEAVGFKESGNDYGVINQFGYLGKYQFGAGTLQLIGIYNTKDFLNQPALQEAAFYANAARNKWILRREIKRFANKTVGGVKVTESGILAAAHLAGPGSVKKFLRSGGAQGFADAFGTSIKYYLKRFAGYDTSIVPSNRKAKAVTFLSKSELL